MLHSRHSNRSLKRCTIAARRVRRAARWRTPPRRPRRMPSRSSRSDASGGRRRSSSRSTITCRRLGDPSASRDRRPRARPPDRQRRAGRSPSAAAPRASRRRDRRDRAGPAAPSATHPRLRRTRPPPRRPPRVGGSGDDVDDRHVETDEDARAFRKRAEPARHHLGGFADHLAAAAPAVRSCRRAHTAGAGSRGSRWSCRPSSGDCGCCSSGGWRSRDRCPRCESISGFSIRSRNCRA